jgi:ferric-dicitrate binding protein FerR (iron transport regulator)
MEIEPPEAPRTLRMLLGRLWLSLLPGERVDVDTPQGVLGVKGTSLRVLVDPEVGTFLAVDEGLVTVQAKAGGDPVDVKKGQWVVIPPGGLPTRPTPLGPGDEFLEDPLLPCCPGGEPPKPPPSRSP